MLTIIELDWANGDITKTMQSTSLNYSDDYMNLLITSNDSEVYFPTIEAGTNKPMIWKAILSKIILLNYSN